MSWLPALSCPGFITNLSTTSSVHLVGDYTGKAFGFETFGTVYGLLNCVAGLFGLVNRPIDLLVKGPLRGNYDYVNVAGAVLGVVSAAAITWRIYRKPSGQIMLIEDDEEIED